MEFKIPEQQVIPIQTNKVRRYAKDGTFMVTLPRGWVQSVGLNAGDNLLWCRLEKTGELLVLHPIKSNE